ncbi:MAG TPA: pitrilysin family protein [Gemmatimonadaceae bacterium]
MRHSRTVAVALSLVASASGIAQTPARETPPKAGTPKETRLPKKHEFTLANGMQVTFIPFGTIPKTNMTLVIRAGNVNESANQLWLADLMGDLMREGTSTRTATQISETMAGMGGGLGVGVQPDQMTVASEVLSEFAPNALAIIADVAMHPAFPEKELARLKTARVRQVAIQRSSAGALAREQYSAAVYGDHPYGRIYPTEQLLQSYTIDQVKAFYAANVGAARAHLYVAGVFDQAAMEKTVRQLFADWARGPAPVTNVPATTAKRGVMLSDRPNAVQSAVVIGLPVAVNPSSSDYTTFVVTNELLGGAFGSRITSNIREQKGYTYSPFSSISTHYHDANWSESADVTTAVTGASIREIFGEITRLRNEAPTADELRAIQNGMVGTFTLQNATRGGLIGQLAFVNLQGLGDDYLTGYVGRVLGVTPADVQRTAQKYLDPSKMVIAVVGDKKTVEAQLAPWTTVP